ncbi:helix-turn-helix domain-containing protein [Staphylococcus epidermidis]|uniref:helix-turn-helix domain-containing protein n=1 Tax=Staphylococcus epidermidis TaxID=1282 RepID=UPI0010681E6A|nr:helix-turn-helix transcriptional regulator [Staphylococcus epidermidis]TER96776.1 XRE family transcriptional regulator [Staphylococcus epidermidis]TES21688.1 XRE family transcriptional regulator [Staphylococcus epidermidis]TES21747.1 XRE family transcriptional regulator [Staphylococcus epidermidis]
MKSRIITPEDRIQIAHRINELRMESGITQTEFGERVGVGRLAVNRWENRWQLPPMKTVRKIAEEYNTTPEWLLYGE